MVGVNEGSAVGCADGYIDGSAVGSLDGVVECTSESCRWKNTIAMVSTQCITRVTIGPKRYLGKALLRGSVE